MRPYERWSRLWQLFIALDSDWEDDYSTEEEAVISATGGWDAAEFRAALGQWHEAFDSASDDQLDAIVVDFNPTYEPAERFGGHRQWAEWVREQLEREIAARS